MKQKQHIRRYRTGKVKLVNKGVIKEHKLKGVKLSKDIRGIFSYLDKEPFETGGYLDFDKNGLQNVDMYISHTTMVIISPMDVSS